MINPLSSLPNYGTRTNEITIYAGPCSVESEEQFNEVAECIAGLRSRVWAKKACRS